MKKIRIGFFVSRNRENVVRSRNKEKPIRRRAMNLGGRNATFASQLEFSTNIMLPGRIESRLYAKMFGHVKETRRAFEVSVSLCHAVKNEGDAGI